VGPRARVAPTAAAGQPRGLRESYCAGGGPKACHRTAWCPLARSARTQGDPAALRCPPRAGRGGGRAHTRHANRRCGPTTRTPGELLRRRGAQGIPQGRMVPACAKRAYTGRNSASAGPHGGGWAREPIAPTAAAGQPRRLRGSYCAWRRPMACHGTAWWPLLRITRIKRETAAREWGREGHTPPVPRARRAPALRRRGSFSLKMYGQIMGTSRTIDHFTPQYHCFVFSS